MKVRALIEFGDGKAEVIHKPGDEFVVSKERFEEIMEASKKHATGKPWVEVVEGDAAEEVAEETEAVEEVAEEKKPAEKKSLGRASSKKE